MAKIVQDIKLALPMDSQGSSICSPQMLPITVYLCLLKKTFVEAPYTFGI